MHRGAVPSGATGGIPATTIGQTTAEHGHETGEKVYAQKLPHLSAIRISETFRHLAKTLFVFSTTNMNGNQGSVELPPNFKPCSLKGRPFTPTFDTSCHNTQGIDVWANKGPRPYAPGKSSTLPRKTYCWNDLQRIDK